MENNKEKKNKESLIIYLAIAKNITYDKFFSESKNSLFSNMTELINILKNKNGKKIDILYFYKEKIGQILYDNEEIIEINKEIINTNNTYNISDYFYLILLIKDNPTIINYIYDLDLIKEIKNKLKIEKKNYLKQLFFSKIGIELINNYKNTDNYDESENDELISIEQEFLETIKNNILVFKEFNINYTVDDIIAKKIDEIYIEIIINLIRQKKFENYDTINILKQLDMEYIKLTKKMFDDLNKELEKNEYKLKYKINEPNDLVNSKKINFYYLLIKYILKDPLYIYQIKLLSIAKKDIITNLIKNKNKNSFEIINEESQYIIEKIVDSEYYSKINNKSKGLTNINNKIGKGDSGDEHNYHDIYLTNRLNNNEPTNINTYNDDFEKEKKNNEQINISENNEYYEYMEKILNKSSFLLKSDEKKNISINILNDDEEEKIQKKKIKQKKPKKINDYNILFTNFQKLIVFLYNIKEEIQKQFSNNYNLLIKLKFNKEDINNNLNSIFNITCRYDFYPLNEDTISSFVDENILTNGIYEGFSFLISKINDYDYG